MGWKETFEEWMSEERLEPSLRAELAELTDRNELEDRFYRELEFGTAGLRGVIGAGSNRMNVHTVDRATRGFAGYLCGISASPSCAISYDSRVMSAEFARVTAAALASKGVRVWLYRELMPTPMLSFAVRELGCDGGVMVTASHNPSKYNGYKVYGPDGCQLTVEASERVMELIEEEKMIEALPDFDALLASGTISYIPDSVIEKYYRRVLSLSLNAPPVRTGVVFSPLNGTGNRPVREVLRRLGNIDVTVVPEQELPDGHFPTCPYPNPETREAMELAAALARRTGADIFLATDPDCDRVGAGVVTDSGVRLITGNEMGVLLLDYICRMRIKNGTMPKAPAAIKTIVTTGMAARVAEKYGVAMLDVLTGFKFIGEQIGRWESAGEADRFILGFEESYGYLSGSFVRDKDAVNASMLICEMASWYKSRGMTLVDALDALYEEHGYFSSGVINVAFEGSSGMEEMSALIEGVRREPPENFAGLRVLRRVDYKHDETGLPRSNVLRFFLEDGSEVVIRPSGTEPKLKLYVNAAGKTREDCGRTAEKLSESCRRLAEAR